jgi:hypothetical protein
MRIIGLIGLTIALALGGCQRRSYTEADVREAIAERQRQTNIQIERNVRAAPPVEIENPTSQSTDSNTSAAPTTGNPSGFELPSPNSYESPRPAISERPTPSQPTAVGDVKLDPVTGQYGIHPPGAPDTYTIPLDRTQGQ